MLEGNELRKTLRNRKALSPVIAAIILIAVTVAVSIAVAAWMGSITIGFMETEELRITNVEFNIDPVASDSITVYVQNAGTSDVTITQGIITGDLDETVSGGDLVVTDGTVSKGTSGTVTLTLTGTLSAGDTYKVQLVTSKGNTFGPFIKTAPS